jgi:hypothetical protein
MSKNKHNAGKGTLGPLVRRPICPCTTTIDVGCEIPSGYSHTRKRHKKICSIDKCLAPLIRALQAAKIVTTGCCCGHGECDGTVVFEDGTRLIVIWPWDDDQPNNAICATQGLKHQVMGKGKE